MDSHAPLNANMRQSSVPSQRRGSKSSDAILGGRSKPRASYACLNCRQRKIKASTSARKSTPTGRITHAHASAQSIQYERSATHVGYCRFHAWLAKMEIVESMLRSSNSNTDSTSVSDVHSKTCVARTHLVAPRPTSSPRICYRNFWSEHCNPKYTPSRLSAHRCSFTTS